MNDNRQPIEDALHRYAERRRRAWGGPLTMPAHVRAQLHREIERQSAAEAVRAGGRGFAWWRWLARPWVWGGAAVLVIGLIVWQQIGSSDVKYAVAGRAPAEPLTAPSNPPPAAGAPAAAPSMEVARGRLGAPNASPVADRAEEKSDFFRPVPSAPLPANLVSQTPPAGLARSTTAPEAESKSERYGLPVAVSAPAVRTALRAGGATGGGTAVVTSAPGPGRTPATRRLAAPAPELRAGAAFREVANVPVLQQRYVQAPAAPVTPVLNSFRIEQNGRQIQLVDADGSVYAATLNELPAAQQKAVVATEPAASAPAPTLSFAKEPPPARTISPQASAPSQSVQALVLNAIGTNVRLQQQVVFNGNLLVTNLAGEPVLTNQQALMTNEAALQFLFSNSRLEGQVIVGASNQFPIQAVPIPH